MRWKREHALHNVLSYILPIAAVFIETQTFFTISFLSFSLFLYLPHTASIRTTVVVCLIHASPYIYTRSQYTAKAKVYYSIAAQQSKRLL